MVKKILAGNEQAFRLLIEKYKQLIYQAVYPILRNEKDAEDVTQEAFIKIYYSLSRYQKQGLKTWMTRIAVNHAIDIKRKRSKQQGQDQALVETIPTNDRVEETVIHKEQIHTIRNHLKKVPERYRDVIVAFYIEGKSYREIAKEQETEVKTIEMRLYRARKWIRDHWKEDEFR